MGRLAREWNNPIHLTNRPQPLGDRGKGSRKHSTEQRGDVAVAEAVVARAVLYLIVLMKSVVSITVHTPSVMGAINKHPSNLTMRFQQTKVSSYGMISSPKAETVTKTYLEDYMAEGTPNDLKVIEKITNQQSRC